MFKIVVGGVWLVFYWVVGGVVWFVVVLVGFGWFVGFVFGLFVFVGDVWGVCLVLCFDVLQSYVVLYCL